MRSSERKFNIIEEYIELDAMNGSTYLLVIPSLSAVAYVFIFPLLSLASTTANAIYERWNSDIKVWHSRKAVLTKEQREMLIEKVTALNTELRTKAEEAASTIEDMEKSFNAHLKVGAPLLLKAYGAYVKSMAPTWGDDATRMPEGRTIKADEEMLSLVKKYGIPNDWAAIFLYIGPGSCISVAELESQAGCDRIEAFNRLVSLTALGMLKMDWSGSILKFSYVESSWVAMLNGRPA